MVLCKIIIYSIVSMEILRRIDTRANTLGRISVELFFNYDFDFFFFSVKKKDFSDNGEFTNNDVKHH